jgi:hypothetical protein
MDCYARCICIRGAPPQVDHLDVVGGLLHQRMETKNSQNVPPEYPNSFTSEPVLKALEKS